MRGRILLPILAILFLGHVSFASTALPSARPATAADLELMRKAGIQDPTVGMLWNPDDPLVGQEAGEVKAWLAQHAAAGAQKDIMCLNSDFATRLKGLMESIPGGPPRITDGYRSPQEQANLPAGSTQAAPCSSYHQYGMAADFNEASPQVQRMLRVNAAQFGLAPVTDTIRGNADPNTGCTLKGFCDGGHIQMAGPLPPRNQCGVCSGGPGAGGMLGNAGNRGPLSPFTDMLRQYLGGGQQQPSQGTPPSMTPPPATAQQPYPPQVPSIPDIPATNPSTSPSTTGYENLLSNRPVSDTLNQGGTAPSTLDILNNIAYDTTQPVPTTPGAPLALNQNLAQATGVQPNQGAIAEQGPQGAYALPPSQQTFTSADLRYDRPGEFPVSPPSTGLARTLESLKQALLWLAERLRPFGGTEVVSPQEGD